MNLSDVWRLSGISGGDGVAPGSAVSVGAEGLAVSAGDGRKTPCTCVIAGFVGGAEVAAAMFFPGGGHMTTLLVGVVIAVICGFAFLLWQAHAAG